VTLRRAAVRAAAAVVLAAPAVLGLLPGTGGELSVGRAAAVGGPQFCTEEDGVTVVVDLRGLDPDAPVLVRCAEGPAGSGHTGFDALADAGLSYVMPQRQPGVVCRLATSTGVRPAPGEQIPVRGDDDYVERCVNTPPTAAYWSYWYAPQGGRWQYSSSGAGNRSTIPGGFEGWSFSLNHSPSAAPPPRVAPDNPNAPYDGGGNGNGGNGNGNGGGGNGGGGNGGNGGGGNGGGGNGGGVPNGSSGQTTAPTTPGPSAPPDVGPDREPGEGAKAENSPGDRDNDGDSKGDDGRSDPTDTAPPDDVARSDVTLTGDVPAATTAGESGPPLATVVGLGVLAVLAAAVGLVAWRRRPRGAHLP